MRTTLPASRYETDDRIRAFSRELSGAHREPAGVRAVGSANYLPMAAVGAAAVSRLRDVPHAGLEDQTGSWISVVGGDYFEAMGIPLLRGRLPGDADTEKTQPVFVIDEELARRHWPGDDAIGARIAWRRDER